MLLLFCKSVTRLEWCTGYQNLDISNIFTGVGQPLRADYSGSTILMYNILKVNGVANIR